MAAQNSELLYPMVNLIPQLRKPYWKVSSLVILQSRTQILRAVTAPLTQEILKNAEETLQFRKYYEEQLCQITNYGLTFVNHVIMERLKNACCYVPHHLFIELDLHRKPPSSCFARKILKKIAKREAELGEEELKILPLHPNYNSDELLKNYVETPLKDQKVDHVTLVLEVKIGEKNSFKESKILLEDLKNVTLTEDDEKFLAKAKETLEKAKESLGKICVRYMKPSVFSARDLFSDINMPALPKQDKR